MGDGRHSGKRVAERRPRRSWRSRLAVFPLAVGITLCVVAWGYLVKAAIDFGTTARTGSSGSAASKAAWTYLGLASLGAIACLFVGLMLVARIGRVLGWGSKEDEPARSTGPRPVGGRRRAK